MIDLTHHPMATQHPPQRILVIRSDRIGDVILSTPALRAIRESYPRAFLAFLVSPYTKELLQHNPDVDAVMVDDALGIHRGVRGFFRLAGHLRRHRFDTAVFLYLTIRVALLVLLAGIRRRIGPRTNVASLVLTQSIRQARSRGTRHEAEYNLELAGCIGATGTCAPVLHVSDHAREEIGRRMEGWGIRKEWPFIGIHPGSGGSSRNWPLHSYNELVEDLGVFGKLQVCVTGAQWEGHLLEHARMHGGGNVFTYSGEKGLDEFAALLQRFDVFVSGSTGPMHMAAALGVPIVALFCPHVACSPVRWGPLTDRKIILMPHIGEGCDLCAGEKCSSYDCMETISVEEVRSSIFCLLEKSAKSVQP